MREEEITNNNNSVYKSDFMPPNNLTLDVTNFEKIKFKKGISVYELDVEKFLESFCTLVEVVC